MGLFGFGDKPGARFDLAAIGEQWRTRALSADRTASVSIRVIDDDFDRGPFPFVALIQPLAVVLPDQFDRWTAATHFALERDGDALLVLVHREPRLITWYAHAATKGQLERCLKALKKTNPVRWGIHHDREWADYDRARLHGGE